MFWVIILLFILVSWGWSGSKEGLDHLSPRPELRPILPLLLFFSPCCQVKHPIALYKVLPVKTLRRQIPEKFCERIHLWQASTSCTVSLPTPWKEGDEVCGQSICNCFSWGIGNNFQYKHTCQIIWLLIVSLTCKLLNSDANKTWEFASLAPLFLVPVLERGLVFECEPQCSHRILKKKKKNSSILYICLNG